MIEYVNADTLYETIKNKNGIHTEIGNADIAFQNSDSDITYTRWDIEFHKDIDAGKKDNSGCDEVQIIFNLNQDIEWNVGNKEDAKVFMNVPMKKGEVCIYRNNDTPTSMYYKSGINFRFKSLQMPTKRFKILLENHFKKEEIETIEEIVYKRVAKTRITSDMYRILSEIDSADRYKEFKGVFLEAKMTELTAKVLFEIMYHSDDARSAIIINDMDSKAVEKLRENIQLEPYRDYNAVEVSRDLSMSVSKLNRIFRDMYATSLHAYVQEMRLEYAAELLISKDYNITEVAIRSGYDNMSHFAKKFKERFGITPKKFHERKVLKKD